MSIFNYKAVKAVSFLWLSSLFGAGCAFLTQVLLARALDVEDFGVFSSAFATVMLFVPLAGFGVAPLWLKVFGEEGWEARRWLAGSFKFVSLSSILVIFSLSLWALWGPHDETFTGLVMILSVYVLGQLSVELVGSKLQLEEGYIGLAVWQFAPHFLRLFVIIAAYLVCSNNFDAYVAAYIYSAVSAAVFVLGLFFLARMFAGDLKLVGHGQKIVANISSDKSMLQVGREAWPFGAGNAFYLIYFQSVVVVVSYLGGPQAAGIYNVAFVVMTAVYLFPSVLYQKFLLPKIHRWANKDFDLLEENYRKGNVCMLIAGLCAMVMVWIFSPWAVPFLFGTSFSDAVVILNILAVAAPFRFVATSVGAVLVTKDHMKKKVGFMGGVALVNVSLNLFLIPVFGVVGAAISAVISDALLLALYLFSVNKYVFKRGEV